MGYISDSKSYREFMRIMEKEMEDKMIKDKNDILVKDNITALVMEDLRIRSNKGFRKYGTTLHQNNHQNMLQHMYEEALDFAQYIKKEITTLNTVQDLVEQFPNDSELGEEIRKRYAQTKTN